MNHDKKFAEQTVGCLVSQMNQVYQLQRDLVSGRFSYILLFLASLYHANETHKVITKLNTPRKISVRELQLLLCRYQHVQALTTPLVLLFVLIFSSSQQMEARVNAKLSDRVSGRWDEMTAIFCAFYSSR